MKAAKFLLETGLLGEINVKVLHPRGLALVVNVDQDKVEFSDELLVDPEGFTMGNLLGEIREKLKRAPQIDPERIKMFPPDGIEHGPAPHVVRVMPKMSYTPAIGGYGARLFLQTQPDKTYEECEELTRRISNLSVWGGCDKRGQNFESFEFKPEKIGRAMQVAAEYGYVMDNHDWQEW